MFFRTEAGDYPKIMIGAWALVVTHFLVCTPANARKPIDWLDYSAALKVMNAAEVHTEYTGSETAIAQFEGRNLFWDAVEANTRMPVFGNCSAPAARAKLADKKALDRLGWAPAGDNCKVAWVMATDCGWSAKECVKGGAHATNVAKGIIATAPDTRIISIRLASMSGKHYQLAVEWLLTPTTDENYPDSWYTANGYSDAQFGYYQTIFGGKSPAEYWNIVAVNASYYAGPIIGQNTSRDGAIYASFSGTCELSSPGNSANPRTATGQNPHIYIDDWWVAHAAPRVSLQQYEGYASHSRLLRNAGIIPFFAAGNFLWHKKIGEIEYKYRTRNGLMYPACLNEVYGVAGVPMNFDGVNKKYISTLAHPEMNQVVAPGGTSSHSTGLMSGAVAVLRSPGLAPDADLNSIESFLRASNNTEATAGQSCGPDADNRESIVFNTFPDGVVTFWNEHDSLKCESTANYTLPVLDLEAAVNKAKRN